VAPRHRGLAGGGRGCRRRQRALLLGGRGLGAPGALAELWTFFPDPWPKTRHHKRRIVDATFAAVAASRLAPGGTWRLATDWGDYADQMIAVLGAVPELSGGVTERWAERPVTKFERKGVEAGRTIIDLVYRRA
jgi:tRNA (guanine-N7-)-methyltransferase